MKFYEDLFVGIFRGHFECAITCRDEQIFVCQLENSERFKIASFIKVVWRAKENVFEKVDQYYKIIVDSKLCLRKFLTWVDRNDK
jgi:hypothetical protein